MENKAYNKQNNEMKVGGYMLKMIDLYRKHLSGETFKELSEMNLDHFSIKKSCRSCRVIASITAYR